MKLSEREAIGANSSPGANRAAAACATCWRITGAAALAAVLVACGGGGGSGGDAGGGVNAGGDASAPTLAQRIAAATATAQSGTNYCAPVRPFYWEIGDGTGARAAGSVSSPTDPTVYDANSLMAIASASKWIYGAYVAELRRGVLSSSDLDFLTFRSGYTSFSSCQPGQSVDECVSSGRNGVHTPTNDGVFSYGGGHMEKHASLNGLGPLHNAELKAEIQGKIGSDIAIAYSQPQLAGGIYTTANDYARFLRKLLNGQLQLGALLGSSKVCTNPATCAKARSTPVPSTESWDYSIGHWVEDDPAVGDGTFSSAGAFGFYPWIDAGKTWYGIIARKQIPQGDPDLDQTLGEGYRSVQCGRQIRAAWISAVAR